MQQCICGRSFRPRKNPHTGENEEICSTCLLIALQAAYDIEEEVDDIESSLDAYEKIGMWEGDV